MRSSLVVVGVSDENDATMYNSIVPAIVRTIDGVMAPLDTDGDAYKIVKSLKDSSIEFDNGIIKVYTNNIKSDLMHVSSNGSKVLNSFDINWVSEDHGHSEVVFESNGDLYFLHIMKNGGIYTISLNFNMNGNMISMVFNSMNKEWGDFMINNSNTISLQFIDNIQ